MKKLLIFAALIAVLALSGCSVLGMIAGYEDEIILDNEDDIGGIGDLADDLADELTDDPADDPADGADDTGAQAAPRERLSAEGAVEGFEVGDIAPDFEVQLLDGTSVMLSDYRGSMLFLNFWATWCGPCVGEMPHMQSAYDTYGDLHMLAVNMYEDQSDVQSFIDENGFTFHVGLQTTDDVASLYGIEAIPQTYVINEEGVIEFTMLGSMDAATMDAAISAFMG